MVCAKRLGMIFGTDTEVLQETVGEDGWLLLLRNLEYLSEHKRHSGIDEIVSFLADIKEKINSIKENKISLPNVPSIGDFILIDGETHRIAYLKTKGERIAVLGIGDASFYANKNGGCNLSCGSLRYPALLKDTEFVCKEEKIDGSVWSFLVGTGRAMGINFNLSFNVWEMVR